MDRKKFFKQNPSELPAPGHIEVDGVMCETYSCEVLKGAQFEGRDLSRVFFYDADLSYANLARVRVHVQNPESPHELHPHFAGAKLRHANMHHADLRYCCFRCTDLGGADLRGADLRGAMFYEAKITNTDLRGSDLTDAVFEDCSFYKTHFDGAILQGASFNNVTMWESQVRKLALTKEQLEGIRIQTQLPTDIPVKIGTERKSQIVFQYTPKGELVGVYSSLAEMHRKTGFKKNLVRMSCEAPFKSIGISSHYWSYELI